MDFSCEYAYEQIHLHWLGWTSENKISPFSKWVVGISGGKDSAVVAALAVRIFGKDNVLGVTLPCDGQDDFDDGVKLMCHLGIQHCSFDIGNCVRAILDGLDNNTMTIPKISQDTRINLPARIRMASLYAVAQSVGGIVLNTSNLSENCVSYSTLYGDHAGSYGPIQGLTVGEVMQLGDWLGLPHELVHKTPKDGLQPNSDEERLGMSYEEIDRFIRTGEGSYPVRCNILNRYSAGKFKLKMVDIPGYKFLEYPNFIRKFDQCN